MGRGFGVSRIAILLIIASLVASLTSCGVQKPAAVSEVAEDAYTVSVSAPESLLTSLVTGDEANPQDIGIDCVKPVQEGTLLVWRDGTSDRLTLLDPEKNILGDLALSENYSGVPVSVARSTDHWVILSKMTDEIFHTQYCVTRVSADFSTAEIPVQLDGLTDLMVYGFAYTADTLVVAADNGVSFYDAANHFALSGQMITETPVYDLAVCDGKLLAIQDKDTTVGEAKYENGMQVISCDVLLSEVDVSSRKLTNTRTIFTGETYAMHLFGDTEGFDKTIGIAMSKGFYEYALDGSSFKKFFENSEYAASLSIQSVSEIYRQDVGNYRAYGYYNATMSDSYSDRQLLMQISPSSGLEKTPIQVGVLHSYSAPGITLISDYINRQDLPFTLEVTVYMDMEDPDFELSQIPAAKLAFLRDALSDDPPDLLILTPMEREIFAAQDALLDLTPFVENSKALQPEDMMPNVWSAITSDQSCDWIPPYFTLTGNMVSEEYIEELGQVVVPDILSFYENHADEPLEQGDYFGSFYPLMTTRINELNDGAGDPSQEKQALVDLVSLMVNFRQQSASQNGGSSIRVATVVKYLSSLQRYVDQLRSQPGPQVFRGEFGQLDEGLGIEAEGGISISAGTDNVDLAWSAIEVLLSEDVLDLYGYGIPLRQASFETMLLQDINFVQNNDAQGEVSITNDGVEVPTYDKPLDATIIAQYRQDVLAANSWIIFDEDLYVLILEELDPCLAGDISAEDCADRLIERVGLYQSERENG